MPGEPPETAEALAALERLVTKFGVITPEDAQRLARVITRDPTFAFPVADIEARESTASRATGQS